MSNKDILQELIWYREGKIPDMQPEYVDRLIEIMQRLCLLEIDMSEAFEEGKRAAVEAMRSEIMKLTGEKNDRSENKS